MPTFLVGLILSFGLGILARLLAPKPPDQEIVGPRLDDLEVTHSAYGQAINLADGTIALNGGVIWAGDGIIEEVVVTVEEVSDGGLFGTGFLERTSKITTTEYKYYLSWAVAFAEGPASRFLRVWMNDRVVYDSRGTNRVSRFSPAFYLGTETQWADPVVRAHVDGKHGSGSTPAYLGIAYVRYERMPLEPFNNAVPNIRAEIAFDSTASYPRDDLTELSGLTDPGEWWWGYDPTNDYVFVGSEAAGGEVLLIDATSMVHVHTIPSSQGFLNGGYGYGCLMSDGRIVSTTSTLGGTNGRGLGRIDLGTGLQDATAGSGSGNTGDENGTSFNANGLWADETIKIRLPGAGGLVGEIACHFPSNGGIGLVECRSMTLQESNIGLTNTLTGGDASVGVGVGLGVLDPDANVVYFWQDWTASASDPDKQVLWRVAWSGAWDGEGLGDDAFTAHYDGPQAGVTVTEVGRYDPDTELFVPAGVLLLIEENAMIVTNGAKAAGDSTARMARIDLSDGSVDISPKDTSAYGSFKGVHKVRGSRFAYPNQGGVAEIETASLGLIRQSDAADDIGLTESAGKSFDDEFLYDERRHAVLVDRVGLGLPGDSPKRTRIYLGRGSGDGTPLNDVITRYCARARVDSGDLSLAATSAITVQGYALTRSGMSAADGMEPLRVAYFFDLVESDWALKSVVRGGASAFSISEDDLGEFRDDPEEPPVEEVRTQEVEIPRELELSFSNRGRDYETDVVAAMRMLGPAPAMNSADRRRVDLGTLVLDPDDAIQRADTMLWTMWEEPLNLLSRAPWTYVRGDPADVVTATYRGETRTLRLGEVEVGANLALEFKATQEAAHTASSSSTADGTLGAVLDAGLADVPTKLILLDAPVLDPRDESGGQFLRGYLGASGFGNSGWRGASVLRDGRLVASSDEALAWGVLTSAPSAWDALRSNRFQRSSEGGTLTVIMRDGGSLLEASSMTGELSDVLKLDGDYVGAVVTGGAVELIFFRDISALGNQRYTLSHLVRGRFGTEDVAKDATHAQGSLFVLVRRSAIRTFESLLSDQDVAREYVAVTFGQAAGDGAEVTHTDTGRDRRPLGPSLVKSTDTGSALRVTWHRRGRVNAVWGQGGTSSIPLVDEDLDQFSVVLSGTQTDAGSSVTKTVTDGSGQADFTEAEVSQVAGASWVSGQDLPPGLEVTVTQASGTPGVDGIPTTEALS